MHLEHIHPAPLLWLPVADLGSDGAKLPKSILLGAGAGASAASGLWGLREDTVKGLQAGGCPGSMMLQARVQNQGGETRLATAKTAH